MTFKQRLFQFTVMLLVFLFYVGIASFLLINLVVPYFSQESYITAVIGVAMYFLAFLPVQPTTDYLLNKLMK